MRRRGSGRATLVAVFTATLLLAGGRAAHGQSAAAVTIAPDADVRATMITGPERRIGGKFVRMTTDTLVLSRDRRGTQLSLPLAQVRQLEVRGGRQPWRGARWGAGIVGGIALVFGGIDVGRGELGAGEYIAAVAGNALIGGLVGYVIAPRGWVAVRP